MTYKDFPFLNVPMSLGRYKNSQYLSAEAANYYYKGELATNKTQIEFLMKSGLLLETASAWNTPIEQAVIRLSDLTDEGQRFVMSQAMHKWLGACDRKSNDMLKRGASNEERLAVQADPAGLYKRLEKFRKDQAAKAH